MRYVNVIKAMLAPGRVFSVEGLCRMNHVPDIGGTLESLGWIEDTVHGTKWVGPVPKNEEEEKSLFEIVEKAAGEEPVGRADKSPSYMAMYAAKTGVSATVPAEVKTRLLELAKEAGLTLSKYARHVLVTHIASMGK